MKSEKAVAAATALQGGLRRNDEHDRTHEGCNRVYADAGGESFVSLDGDVFEFDFGGNSAQAILPPVFQNQRDGFA